jgi:hypothetical protein
VVTPQLPQSHAAPRPTSRQPRGPDLDIEQILAWADDHHAFTGKWPTKETGFVAAAPGERWVNIDAALRQGLRGLAAGSSLAGLLQQFRGVRNRKALPPFFRDQILGWADAHHARTGEWPRGESGRIREAPEETWMAVDMALRNGIRGLPGGSSLPRLLHRYRGLRNKHALPWFSEAHVLEWADAYHARTGRWPSTESGPVAEAPGETWHAIQHALKRGTRGLPGGTSLAQFLEQHRGAPNHLNRPDLQVHRILEWADAHRARTGRWPTGNSGPIPEAPGEQWSAVDSCLRQGNRSLPGGSSLHRLLGEHRDARKQGKVVRVITAAQILTWADAWYEQTGRWPNRNSGAVPEAPGLTWNGIDLGLSRGHHGLPGASSLALLLSEQRGTVRRQDRDDFTVAQILAWAEAHLARTGRWPAIKAGAIPEAPGETWERIDRALRRGFRGVEAGSSLARLLAAERGVRNEKDRPPLSEALILQWADAYSARTGTWPTRTSGPIPETEDDQWSAVDASLHQGNRGLPGGCSLCRLLQRERGARNRPAPRRLPYSLDQILAWADAFRARHGGWPSGRCGPIEDAPDETWAAVESALRNGARGLPGGSSLGRLFREHRGPGERDG